MNKIFLIGRLTRDIELRASQSGKSCIRFSVACDNGKDKNGEKLPADFVECVAWEKRAETLSKYVKKGDRLSVTGKFKTDKYETEHGETRYRAYCLVGGFEFLESKKDGFEPSEPIEISQTTVESDPYAEFGNEYTLDQSELPFE